MKKHAHVIFVAFIILLLPVILGSKLALAKTVEVLIEPPKQNAKVINSRIYGFGTYMREDLSNEAIWALKPGHFRFGGNMAERFNWKINAWNAGADWFFKNSSSRFPQMIDFFLSQCQKFSTPVSVTLPLLGWVAKDDSSASYPLALYPSQEKTYEGYGNGKLKNGDDIIADPTTANIAIDEKFIKDWVTHLKSRFGSQEHQYIIGNEPMLWHQSHKDVHPSPVTYERYLARYLQMAKIIRRTDPQAILIGPALWGPLAVEESAYDTYLPKYKRLLNITDRNRHENKPFLEWFISQVVKEEKITGSSLLDILDVHYYPEGEKLRNLDPASSASRMARIRSTRSLWDDDYVDDSWLNRKVRLIPYLKELKNNYKPSLKLAIGEYNFRAENDISGAIVQAELLGIFSLLGLDQANYWTVPPPKSSAAAAFKLFRDFDNKGSMFGEILVGNNINIEDSYAIFSSWSALSKKYTIILINKSLESTLNFSVNLAKKMKLEERSLYYYNDSTEQVIKSLNLKPSDLVSLKPLTISVLEIKEALSSD